MQLAMRVLILPIVSFRAWNECVSGSTNDSLVAVDIAMTHCFKATAEEAAASLGFFLSFECMPHLFWALFLAVS